MDFLLPWDPGVPIQCQRGEDVEDDKGPHDAEVAPAVGVLGAEGGEVRVRAAAGAEVARRCDIWVGEVTAKCVHISLHVLIAGFVGGRIEVEEFNGGAGDFVVGQAGREHAVDQIGERRNAVHEDPEARESSRASEDSGIFVSNGLEDGESIRDLPAEDQRQGKEQLGEVPCCLRRIDASYHHVGEGRSEY